MVLATTGTFLLRSSNRVHISHVGKLQALNTSTCCQPHGQIKAATGIDGAGGPDPPSSLQPGVLSKEASNVSADLCLCQGETLTTFLKLPIGRKQCLPKWLGE